MKTIWGFEPKNQKRATVQGMAKLVKQFAPGRRDIDVAYVVTENELHFQTAYDVPLEERFSTYPKTLILNDLREAKVPIQPNDVHVLRHRTLSITSAADHLLRFAKSQRAQLLTLFTHNKKGLERLVMGSFAETVIHRSRIDLLIGGPKTKYAYPIRSILYASDFTPSSKRELQRVLKICRHLGAQLTVFHAPELTYRWSLDESNPKIQAYRKKVEKMASWIRNECKKARVKTDVVLFAEIEPTSKLIYKAAKKAKADLIIVGAKVGPFAALMGGSVTRSLVREGKYPVLILKHS